MRPKTDSDAGNSPPQLLGVDLEVEEYPEISWVLEVEVHFVDSDQDVDGGSLELYAALNGEDTVHHVLPIDGIQALVRPDRGTVFTAIMISGRDVWGTVDVILVDRAGNYSDVLHGSLD